MMLPVLYFLVVFNVKPKSNHLSLSEATSLSLSPDILGDILDELGIIVFN